MNLRDGSARASISAATLRQDLQNKLTVSRSYNGLTPGRLILALTGKHISPGIRRFYVRGNAPSWTGSVDSTFAMCTFGFGCVSTATAGVVVREEVNEGSELYQYY